MRMLKLMLLLAYIAVFFVQPTNQSYVNCGGHIFIIPRLKSSPNEAEFKCRNLGLHLATFLDKDVVEIEQALISCGELGLLTRGEMYLIAPRKNDNCTYLKVSNDEGSLVQQGFEISDNCSTDSYLICDAKHMSPGFEEWFQTDDQDESLFRVSQEQTNCTECLSKCQKVSFGILASFSDSIIEAILRTNATFLTSVGLQMWMKSSNDSCILVNGTFYAMIDTSAKDLELPGRCVCQKFIPKFLPMQGRVTSNAVTTHASQTTDKLTTDQVINDKLTTNKITDDTLNTDNATTDKLKTDKVTTDKLTTDKLTTDKVTTDKLTTDKLTTDKVTTDKLTTDKVTTVKLTTNQVTTERLTTDQVTTDKLITDKPTTDKMTAYTLTTDKLTTDYLTTDQVTTDKLTTDKLTTDKLTTYKLTMDKLTTDKLTTDKLTTDKKTTNIVATDKLTTDELTTDKLTTDKLTTAKLTTAKLTTDKLTTDQVTTDKLTTDKLTTDNLTTDKLTTAKLSTDKLTTDQLTTDKLTSDKLTTDKLTTDQVTTDKLTTDKLTIDYMTTDKLITDKLTTAKLTTDKLTTDKLTTDKQSTDKLTTDKLTTDMLATDKLTKDTLTTDKMKSDYLRTDALKTENLSTDKLTSVKLTTDTPNWLIVDLFEYLVSKDRLNYSSAVLLCRDFNATLMTFTSMLRYFQIIELLALAKDRFWMNDQNTSSTQCLTMDTDQRHLGTTDCLVEFPFVCSRFIYHDNPSQVLSDPSFVNMIKEMTVKKNATSKSTRMLTSARDNRLVAKTCGGFAIALVSGVFIFLMFSDISMAVLKCVQVLRSLLR
ncbi:uncharacterized protein LOC127881397 [Dreissena polymorpha]|uniref:uncharacterized protein LOC127881397 n=1 Tax=Dreissena polymorpha TaxID=45954 RepID=UPI0022650CAD|nr:uncharacterized protein LOC127881397 [Dreissena polymorpha]